MQPEPADEDGSPSPPAPGDDTPDHSFPSPRKWRRAGLLSALVLSLVGLAFAAAGIVSAVLPRQFTAAQQHRIEAWEVAGRWRVLPEGKIFPVSVSYQLPGFALDGTRNLSLTAVRLGVGSSTRCAPGAGPAAARVLARNGCTAVLRATYADSTGTMVATVGVAVLPSGHAAAVALSQLGSIKGSEPGTVRPLAVRGTQAARFDDSQRQLARNVRVGPYVVLTTVGYADGRPQVHIANDGYIDTEMETLATGLGGASSAALGQTAPTPRCPGSPGC